MLAERRCFLFTLCHTCCVISPSSPVVFGDTIFLGILEAQSYIFFRKDIIVKHSGMHRNLIPAPKQLLLFLLLGPRGMFLEGDQWFQVKTFHSSKKIPRELKENENNLGNLTAFFFFFPISIIFGCRGSLSSRQQDVTVPGMNEGESAQMGQRKWKAGPHGSLH